MQVTLLENYCFVKFHEILTSGSLENSLFPLKSPVTIFCSNAHAWLLIRVSQKDERRTKRLSSLGTQFLCSAINEEGFTNKKLSYFKSKTYLLV